MLKKVTTTIFGSQNERDLKKKFPLVKLINELEPETQKLSDEELAKKTISFKERIEKGESLDSICLLYTSPSPRDATLSRMPSSA